MGGAFTPVMCLIQRQSCLALCKNYAHVTVPLQHFQDLHAVHAKLRQNLYHACVPLNSLQVQNLEGVIS